MNRGQQHQENSAELLNRKKQALIGQLDNTFWDNSAGQTRHGGLADHSTGLGLPAQFRSSYNGWSDRLFSRGGINSEAIEPQGLHDFSIVLSMMSGK